MGSDGIRAGAILGGGGGGLGRIRGQIGGPEVLPTGVNPIWDEVPDMDGYQIGMGYQTWVVYQIVVGIADSG